MKRFANILLLFTCILFGLFEDRALLAQSPKAPALDAYSRARWLSDAVERERNVRAGLFLTGGGLALATGLGLHFVATRTDDEWETGLHIGGGLMDLTGLALLGIGTYYFFSDESITEELVTMEKIVPKEDKDKLNLASELLLEDYANYKKNQRILRAISATAAGLGIGVGGAIAAESKSAKASLALYGAGLGAAGIYQFFTRTRAEIFWERRYRHFEGEESTSRNVLPFLSVLPARSGGPQFALGVTGSF